MIERPEISRRTRLQAFADALRGFRWLWQSQLHARIHCPAAAAAISLGMFLKISRMEWCGILFAIAFVLVTEALNTAIELLGDALTLEPNSHIGKAKDIAAAAVLLASIAAAIIGALIFIPHLLALKQATPSR